MGMQKVEAPKHYRDGEDGPLHAVFEQLEIGIY